MLLKVFLTICVFSGLVSCNSNGQKNISKKQDTIQAGDTLLKIYSYGIANLGDDADQLIAKKYGFQYISGGCTITEEESKKAEINNNEVFSLLEKRNGKGWQQRLNEDIKKAREVNAKVIALVFKEPYIIQLNKELRVKSEYVHFKITPVNNLFDVKAYGEWDEEKKGSVVYYSMRVNVEREKVILTSDKHELLSQYN